jgi:uncharacterized OB-fold protein
MVFNDGLYKSIATTKESLEKYNHNNNKEISGWQCPCCKRIYSPYIYKCNFCNNNLINSYEKRSLF